MRHVVIVNAGEYGDLSAAKGSYDSFARGLKATIEELTERVQNEIRPAALVEVIQSLDQITPGRSVDVLIFVSRSMLEESRRFKHQHPRTTVIVLTGLVSDDEVIILDKLWLAFPEDMLRNLILRREV